MHDDGPYSPDAASAGRRALKNVCLDLLAAAGSLGDRACGAAIPSGRQHDRPHGGARDAVAARGTGAAGRARRFLPALLGRPARSSTNGSSLQAAIPEAGTLDRVRALTKHAAFSLTNPNRVRALIGAFAHANQTQFNRADGAGYDFVADTVLALDPKNPQVAARLATAFRSWRALEADAPRHAPKPRLRRVAADDEPVARPARHRRHARFRRA